MAFTKMTASVENVSALYDKPNAEGTPPLNADQLKAVFDKAGVDIQDYLNNTLISELEADGAENIGITAITGMTAETVQEALEALLEILADAQAGVVIDGSITEEKLADLAVTTAKIAEVAVTTAKIADLAVSAAKIAAGAVETAKLANGAVTTDKIAGTAITTEKLGQGAVTAEKTSFLPSTYYGDSLPGSGNEGQIFFKKV